MDQDSCESEKDYLLKSPAISDGARPYRSFYEGSTSYGSGQSPLSHQHQERPSQRSYSELYGAARTSRPAFPIAQHYDTLSNSDRNNGRPSTSSENPSYPSSSHDPDGYPTTSSNSEKLLPSSSSLSSPTNEGSTELHTSAQDSRLHRYRMPLLTVVTFFYACASRLHSPVMTQFSYQYYTDQVYGNDSDGVVISKQPCVQDSGNSSSTDPRNKEVQDKSADLLMQLDMLSGGISVVVNLFLGTYSDLLGRRFVLLVPIIGHFLRNATAPIVIYWKLGVPALYIGYLIDGLCGGTSGIDLGLYVYAADITRSDKQRTVGMAIVDTAMGLTTAATNLAAGYFIEDTGFFYPSLVASACLLICALVVIFLLPETVPRERKSCLSPAEGAKRVFGIFLSRGQKYQRALLLLGLLAFLLAMLPEMADTKLKSLYLMNKPFCWSSIQLGLFLAVKDGGSRIASLFFVKVLQRCLLTPVLAIVAATVYLAGDVLMGLARHDTTVYMVPVVSMAGYMVFAAIRSMMSRMVPPDKQGALFAAIGVAESVCYCLGQFTFLNIYTATMHVYRGFIFFIVGGFHFAIIIIYLIYLCLMRRVIPSQIEPISIQQEDIPES